LIAAGLRSDCRCGPSAFDFGLLAGQKKAQPKAVLSLVTALGGELNFYFLEAFFAGFFETFLVGFLAFVDLAMVLLIFVLGSDRRRSDASVCLAPQ
jgi:hypothetical protein